MKKTRFCFKKNENSSSIKITSIGRKIILKLYLKSYESTVSAFEALNAPKSFLYVLARLKLQSLLFSAKNSRIFDFQILKMARLKAVNTRSVPTCAISSMDPKVTSPMISKHSDASRPRNAPFFEKQWLLYQQKIQQNVAYIEAKVKHYSLHCQTILLGCRYDVSDVYGGPLQLGHQYRTISNAPNSQKLITMRNSTLFIF